MSDPSSLFFFFPLILFLFLVHFLLHINSKSSLSFDKSPVRISIKIVLNLWINMES